VWYWRSGKGEYEFYDNPGFQPRSGEQLTVISREIISAWRNDAILLEKRRKEEQLEQDRIHKQLEEEQRKRTEAEQIRKAAEQAALERDRNAGALCDQKAANPRDPKKAPGVNGVPYDLLKYQAKEAIEVCTKAVQQYPNELRFQYQLARALEFVNQTRALEIHLKLGGLQYPAAYDNAGGLLKHQKRYADAIRQFRLGMRYGDPDAFVDLGDMVHEGLAEGNYIELYQQAARLGHEGAQRALEIEEQKQIAEQQQKANEAEQQRRALETMGNILRGFSR
jgi:hypothetical protein